MRYEFQTVPYDTAGRNSTIPDLLTSSTYRIGPEIDNPSYRNWSPRVGFAWDVFGNGKTSLRSGFGIYYDIANLGSIFTQNLAGVPPFGVQTTEIAPANQVIVLPINSAANGLTAQSLGRSLQDGRLQSGRILHSLQYNLTLEQQLPAGIGLSVSFVGNRGLNILTDEDGDPTLPTNPGPYGPGNAPQYNIANGLAGCQANALVPSLTGGPPTTTGAVFTVNNVVNTLITSPAFGMAGPGPATGSSYPCKTNPYWGSTIFITAASESWYDGLQISVNKRVSHGLTFQAAYTWSHALDTTAGQMYNTDCFNTSSAVGDSPQNLQLDKANTCSDLRHSAHFSFLSPPSHPGFGKALPERLRTAGGLARWQRLIAGFHIHQRFQRSGLSMESRSPRIRATMQPSIPRRLPFTWPFPPLLAARCLQGRYAMR